MSYLNGPRINFWGGGSTNVDTANNEEYSDLIDLANASVTTDKTDQEIIDYLRQPADTFANSGWNYYGNHRVKLVGTEVSSCGQPGSVLALGDLINEPVSLLGGLDPVTGTGPYGGPVMVDLDPTSSQTTQIFAGGLQIGDTSPKLKINANAVSDSRCLGLRYNTSTTSPPYTTPGSAWANGNFQLAFLFAEDKSNLQYDSRIQILKDMIEDPRTIGLVVRFSMFQFYPGHNSDYMQKNLENNLNDANPSLGRIIGTIGPLYRDEPLTVSNGRELVNQNLGDASGLASLNSDTGLLSMDLVSALEGAAIRQDSQAITSADPIGPNVDYENLLIRAGASNLPAVSARTDDYYLYGGIYDVAVDANQLKDFQHQPIEIGSSKNHLQISETPIRVYSDQRNIYTNYTNAPLPTITIMVTQLGGPVQQDTLINLWTAPSGNLPDTNFITVPAQVRVRAGQQSVSFPITDVAAADGFLALNFTLSGSNSTAYFINFRKYPEDDFSREINAGHISWDFTYEQCLRFYYVIFPAMSKIIPLNDQATIDAGASEILKRISDPYRDTTLYMPLTRSLSPGKLALLRAYLEQQ